MIGSLNFMVSFAKYSQKTKMKQLFFIGCLFLFQPSYSQNKVSEATKTESLIRIWGLLKYQHPEVSKGEFDFDEEFINEFNKIQPLQNQEQLNEELLNWIKKFDLGKSKFKTNQNLLRYKNLFSKNADFAWIENSNFSPALIESINQTKNNSAIGDYYASINALNKMVGFKNEKGYANFDSSKKAHRILFLSSFWNAMRYWNVNIYLTDEPWSKVLTTMLPEFNQESAIAFETAKEKLFSKINDSHSNYTSSYLIEKKLNHFACFGGKIVNDSLVITGLYNKDLAQKDNIGLGDVIHTIAGKSTKEYYLHKFSNAISTSNQNYLKARIENYFLLASDKDSIQIGFRKKDGSLENKQIKLYKQIRYPDELYDWLSKPKKENWYKITNSIGYLNLATVTKKELKEAFKAFENTKGIIINLRNYPRNISVDEITNYLCPEKKIFLKVLATYLPSYGEYDIEAPLKIIKNPFVSGNNSKNYYKGKVVLLVDRKTSSHAEFIGMAIQQAPNCITIGEQTFGAVMNRTAFTLTDKTSIDFTGMGAFYPDNEGVQRKGLKIDYLIQESASNYKPNGYLEEAIKIIEK